MSGSNGNKTLDLPWLETNGHAPAWAEQNSLEFKMQSQPANQYRTTVAVVSGMDNEMHIG